MFNGHFSFLHLAVPYDMSSVNFVGPLAVAMSSSQPPSLPSVVAVAAGAVTGVLLALWSVSARADGPRARGRQSSLADLLCA